MGIEEQVKILEELIKIKDEYINLLAEELHEVVPLATLHHWNSTRYEKGIFYRKTIAVLEERLQDCMKEGGDA